MNYEQSLSRFIGFVKDNSQDNDDLDPMSGRFEPYRVNRRVAALVVLRNNFPTVEFMLGARVFSAIGQVYAKIYPSNWWDINVYGSEFSGFLKAQMNSPKADEFDWLRIAEIADLEYAIIDRYYYPGHASTEDVTIHFNRFNFESQGLVCRHHPSLVVSYDFKKVDPSIKQALPKGISSCKEISQLINSGTLKESEKLKYLSASIFRENFQVVSAFSCTTANL